MVKLQTGAPVSTMPHSVASKLKSMRGVANVDISRHSGTVTIDFDVTPLGFGSRRVKSAVVFTTSGEFAGGVVRFPLLERKREEVLGMVEDIIEDTGLEDRTSVRLAYHRGMIAPHIDLDAMIQAERVVGIVKSLIESWEKWHKQDQGRVS